MDDEMVRERDRKILNLNRYPKVESVRISTKPGWFFAEVLEKLI